MGTTTGTARTTKTAITPSMTRLKRGASIDDEVEIIDKASASGII